MTINCCDNCERLLQKPRESYTVSHSLNVVQLCCQCIQPLFDLAVEQKILPSGLVKGLAADPFAWHDEYEES